MARTLLFLQPIKDQSEQERLGRGIILSALQDYLMLHTQTTLDQSEKAEKWLFGQDNYIVSLEKACEWAGVSLLAVRRLADLLYEGGEDKLHYLKDMRT